MSPLNNYRALVARVDEICRTTAAQFASHLSCGPGCDSCCRHLTISAVEAAALTEAARELDPPETALIREKARGAGDSSPCPLLHEGLCLLYHARPLICRTHGLPLLIAADGGRRVDFCPENFRGVSSIPGSAILDLERLNTTLAAVNALYLQSFPGTERISMAEALLRAD